MADLDILHDYDRKKLQASDRTIRRILGQVTESSCGKSFSAKRAHF